MPVARGEFYTSGLCNDHIVGLKLMAANIAVIFELEDSDNKIKYGSECITTDATFFSVSLLNCQKSSFIFITLLLIPKFPFANFHNSRKNKFLYVKLLLIRKFPFEKSWTQFCLCKITTNTKVSFCKFPQQS